MRLLRLWTPQWLGTEMLNDIEMETVNIHTLALAHIISTDLSSMIDIVSEVRNHEEKLKQLLDDIILM